jgi:hypothetical protein
VTRRRRTPTGRSRGAVGRGDDLVKNESAEKKTPTPDAAVTRQHS